METRTALGSPLRRVNQFATRAASRGRGEIRGVDLPTRHRIDVGQAVGASVRVYARDEPVLFCDDRHRAPPPKVVSRRPLVWVRFTGWQVCNEPRH